MKRSAPRLPYIRCPHCGSKAFARTGGKSDTTYREVYYHCREELACGHVFVVGMVILRTIRPSAMPNPEVQLPITSYRAANDRIPPPANDDRPVPQPPAASARLSSSG